MVSFRFHIVSVIAVFLALALGIGMGVTVINEATVDLLRSQLDGVRTEVHAANQRSDALERQLDRSSEFESAAAKYLVNGRLTGVQVTFVAARGIDTRPLDDLRAIVSDAGGVVQGTLWVAERSALSDQRDVNQLRETLELPGADAATLRQALVSRVSGVLTGVSDGSGIKPLVDSGFFDWDGEKAGEDVARVQFGSSRLVVASSANAAVPNDQLLVPLLRVMAVAPALRVVAVEPGREPDPGSPGARAVFVDPLRADNPTNARIATVDNIEMTSGRIATVLALAQLPAGRVGHYGVAGSAQGQMPEPPS